MKTIFRKSLLVLTLAALGISLFFILAVLIFMDSLYYETNTRNLRAAAQAVLLSSPGMDPGEGEDIQRRFALLGEQVPYRFTLVDAGGRVAADSHFDPAGLENHRNRPEIRAALEGREGISRRRSDTAGMENLYAALPVYRGPGDSAGAFRLSLPIPNFWRRIAGSVLPYLYIPALIILAAIAAVYGFSRSLGTAFNRLIRLTQSASAAVSPGPPGALVPGLAAEPRPLISGTGEFRSLEEAIRNMAAELTRRVEEARGEKNRLEAILNGMSEAVFAADRNLSLRLVNPRARELFALPEDRTPPSLLEATRSTALEEAAQRVLTANTPREEELNLNLAGNPHSFRVFAAPLTQGEPWEDEEDEAKGVVIVLEDITRLVRLEQIRKDFVANVSHELRTPIQLVKGFSETLLETLPEGREDLRHGLEIILKNAGAMEDLTGDLLVLAALEDEGSNRPEEEIRDVSPLLEEAAEAARFRARKKNMTVEVECSGDLRAKLQGPLIQQAVVNLLDNAVKYAPSGSRVNLRARGEGKELIIEVQDQGPGIAPEHLERIFERFYRGDRSHSRDPDGAGGTGLGLAIVRHICLLHQGRAEAESHAGEGSLFTLRLPLGTDNAP